MTNLKACELSSGKEAILTGMSEIQKQVYIIENA